MDELDLIYNNLKLQDLGGLSIGNYWSSVQDETDKGYVLVVNFLNGSHDRSKKTYSYEVRGVRAFEN